MEYKLISSAFLLLNLLRSKIVKISKSIYWCSSLKILKAISFFIHYNTLIMVRVFTWNKDSLKQIEFLSMKANIMLLPIQTKIYRKLEFILFKFQVEFSCKVTLRTQEKKIYQGKLFMISIIQSISKKWKKTIHFTSK